MRSSSRAALAASLLAALTLAGTSPAAADPIGSGSASAFGATVVLAGTDVVPPEPAVTVDAPTADDSATTIDLPAEPVAVNGTLTATANVHAASDVESGLTVNTQAVDGPYNARALAQIEGLGVVYEVAGAGVPLVSAAAVRSEAAAVCRAGTVEYTASSEIVDLDVAGTDVPLNAPVEQLIDAITDVLETSGLEAAVDVERNVVTELDGGGIAVDALVVTLLAAAGEDPLAVIRLAHAEVGPTGCGTPPECSDTVDNADAEDTVADADDPGCHTDGNAGNPASYDPLDPSENDAPECSDTVDNADPEDSSADAADPGCHTDGNPGNAATYDPNDDSELDAPAAAPARLPRTGVDAGWMAGIAAFGLLLAVALRRLVRA